MIYSIEEFILDLDVATKAKLYHKEKLMFVGDGYRAINIKYAFKRSFKPSRSESLITCAEAPNKFGVHAPHQD